MGFMILVVMGLYLLIAIGVVLWTAGYARKNGRSAKRWGWSVAVIMWLIPFWDWLPTIITHEYYCTTESGFWVYKTLDQWKKENPGVAETLVAQLSAQSTLDGDLLTINERFAIETHRRKPINFLPTIITERLLIDKKTEQILAKGVDVGSGVGNMATQGGVKFWLNRKPCVAKDFWKLTTKIEKMEKSK